MLLSAPRKLECCPPLLSRCPGPISCGQVLIVNFVLFECLPAELFRRHGKPPVARRAAREAGLRECGARVVSRTAQASEPSESEDDEDKARFVRPFRLCSDFASKAARRERQTNLDHRRLWPVPAGAGRAAAKGQLWRRRRLQPKPQTDVFGKHGGKGTQKHSCTWQDLAAARRLQKVAINQLETAQQAVDTLQAVWLREFQDRNTKEAEKAKQELNDAKQELNDAKQELNNAQTKLEKAKQELKEAKEAVASVRAGREQAGASACAVVAVAFGLQHSRKVVSAFSCGPPFLLCGVMLSSQQGFRSSLSCLHCVGLQYCGEREGLLAWLLQVQANLVALCVLPRLQNGVSVLGSRGGVSAVAFV